MTAVTVTPQAATASVLIEITGAPDGALVINRTDVNGTNTVRQSSGQVPITGVMTITDYEPALVGTLSYEVVDSAGVLTSATDTSLEGLVERPWLSVARIPSNYIELESVQNYLGSRRALSTVHEIVNRADPVVTIGNLQYRRGTLELFASTYSEARLVEGVCDLGEALMLRQTDYLGMDMYFIAENVTLSPQAAVTSVRRWRVDITYTEIRVPTGSLLAALGWDFDALATSYTTFAEVREAFTDFSDLVVGP